MLNEEQARGVVTAPDAPEAIGPYSHAIRFGETLFCSGALPVDPASGALVATTLQAETTQCLANFETICRAAGTYLARGLRLTIYTTALDRFAEINRAYERAFSDQPPARVTVGVAALPKGARVEIDAIVALR